MKKSNLSITFSATIIMTLCLMTGAAIAEDALYIDENGNVGIGTTSPTEKLDVDGGIAAQSFTPLQYNTSSNIYYYKLGNLAGYGARVFLQIIGQNGYGKPATDIIYAAVSIGNADDEYDAWQYSFGNYFTAGKPIVIYKDPGGTNKIDTYVKIGPYFRGSVSIINARGFTLDANPTTPVSNPSGIEATDGYSINSNFGIGATNPSYQLELSTNSAGKPGGGSWSDTSDIRLKTNVQNLTNATDIILDYPKPIIFNWKNPEEHEGITRTVIGISAQDMEEVNPNMVAEIDGTGKDVELTDGKIKSIYYSNEFFALQLAAIQELIERVEDLETENEVIKMELCKKDNSYSFCKKVGG